MRDYNYKEKWHKLLTPEIVKKLTLINEYKGEQRLFIEAHKDELIELVEIAKIQSTEASNRIEGIFTADDRIKSLVQAKTTPRDRDEAEIAGYRDVLNTIHENYDYIPINANYICSCIEICINFWEVQKVDGLRLLTILFEKQMRMGMNVFDLDRFQHGKLHLQLMNCVNRIMRQSLKQIRCF